MVSAVRARRNAVCCRNRETPGKAGGGADIEREAKGRPPRRCTRVRDHSAVKRVKDAMTSDSCILVMRDLGFLLPYNVATAVNVVVGSRGRAAAFVKITAGLD